MSLFTLVKHVFYHVTVQLFNFVEIFFMENLKFFCSFIFMF